MQIISLRRRCILIKESVQSSHCNFSINETCLAIVPQREIEIIPASRTVPPVHTLAVYYTAQGFGCTSFWVHQSGMQLLRTCHGAVFNVFFALNLSRPIHKAVKLSVGVSFCAHACIPTELEVQAFYRLLCFFQFNKCKILELQDGQMNSRKGIAK